MSTVTKFRIDKLQIMTPPHSSGNRYGYWTSNSEPERNGLGRGKQKKVQRQRLNRRICWKGKQKRRSRIWSLLNLSMLLLQPMNCQKSADKLATSTISILLKTIFSLSLLKGTGSFVVADSFFKTSRTLLTLIPLSFVCCVNGVHPLFQLYGSGLVLFFEKTNTQINKI